ncbi:MAG: hypothetical protein ACK4E0_06490 [Chitinophagaceae bacterium]
MGQHSEQFISLGNEDKKKEYFEYIIGFLALVLTLSNFKAELEKIIIDAGWLEFTLSEYLMWLVVYVVAVLHLFFIPFFIRSERYTKLKSGILAIVYSLLFIATVSPLIVGLSIVARIVKLEILAAVMSLVTIGYYVVAIIRSKYKESQERAYRLKLNRLAHLIVDGIIPSLVGKKFDWLRVDVETRNLARKQMMLVMEGNWLFQKLDRRRNYSEVLNSKLNTLDSFLRKYAKYKGKNPSAFGIESTSFTSSNDSDPERTQEAPEK